MKKLIKLGSFRFDPSKLAGYVVYEKDFRIQMMMDGNGNAYQVDVVFGEMVDFRMGLNDLDTLMVSGIDMDNGNINIS